jgi:hypothetical protein
LDPTSVGLGKEKRDVRMTTDPWRISEFVRREAAEAASGEASEAVPDKPGETAPEEAGEVTPEEAGGATPDEVGEITQAEQVGGTAPTEKKTRRRLVVSTYQSSPLIPPDARFSLIIFDEAHRVCGGKEERPFNSVLLSPLAGKRLFMTATPALEAAEISMKDRARFGGVAYRYYLRQGIAAGYVNDFRLRLVAAADDKGGAKGTVSDEALASQIAAAAAEVTKLLVFARDIKQAEHLRGLVETAMQSAGSPGPVDLLCAYSRMPPADIASALRRFCQPGRRALLFNGLKLTRYHLVN